VFPDTLNYILAVIRGICCRIIESKDDTDFLRRHVLPSLSGLLNYIWVNTEGKSCTKSIFVYEFCEKIGPQSCCASVYLLNNRIAQTRDYSSCVLFTICLKTLHKWTPKQVLPCLVDTCRCAVFTIYSYALLLLSIAVYRFCLFWKQELHDLYPSPNIIQVTKSRIMI
jgi:hypothetical protein